MTDVLFALTVFGLAFGVSYLLITRVPQMLHTPLMSMTNAISAVVIIGAMTLLAETRSPLELAFISLAILAAAFNIIGGFAITARMLGMFRSDMNETHRTPVPPKEGPC